MNIYGQPRFVEFNTKFSDGSVAICKNYGLVKFRANASATHPLTSHDSHRIHLLRTLLLSMLLLRMLLRRMLLHRMLPLRIHLQRMLLLAYQEYRIFCLAYRIQMQN